MNLGELVVKLKADLGGFSTNLSQATSRINRFSRNVSMAMARAGRSMLRFGTRVMGRMVNSIRRYARLASLALLGISAGIVKLGADAEESENLFEIAFGSMADSARRWSEDLAQTFKLSAHGIRENAATLNLFLTGMDFTTQQAAEMSQQITDLTYNMASLRNKRFDEMFIKIQAAMAGESEALRRIGIDVSETALKMWAMKNNIDDNTQSWTQQQKVLARLSVIYERADKDMGDIVRTADSVTNLLRSIIDQFREIAIAIYEHWQEPLVKVLKTFRDLLIASRDDIAEWVGYMTDQFVGVITFLYTDWQQGWEKSGEAITLIMEATMDIVRTIVEETIAWIGRNLPKMLIKYALTGWEGVKDLWKGIGVRIGKAINEGISSVMELFSEEWGEDFRRQYEENAANFVEVYDGAAESITDRWNELRADLAELHARPYPGEPVTPEGAPAEVPLTGPPRPPQKSGAEIAAGLREQFRKLQNEQNKIVQTNKETTEKVTTLWSRAAGAISGSMEDAFVKITKNVKDLKSAVVDMLEGIHEALSRAVFQQYIGPQIFGAFGLQTLGVSTMQGPAQPEAMQAQHGLFVPRGVDTVPIMASPGEGLAVIPKGMVDWLKDAYEGGGMGGQPVNVTFNVSAIDAQSTAQFFRTNQRTIAGALGDAVRGNHPYRRRPR